MLLMICNFISAICLWALLCAIVLNFSFAKKSGIIKEKKSLVETGSMLLFFVIMTLIVVLRLLTPVLSYPIILTLSIIGTVIIVFSTIINIIGRLSLKGNWGNQILIYNQHTLVTTGIYKYVRHPLYSSTIAMLYGFSFLYANPLVFILNTVVFIPLMIYRAGQEDKLLLETFGESFINYKNKTGMLFIKVRRT